MSLLIQAVCSLLWDDAHQQNTLLSLSLKITLYRKFFVLEAFKILDLGSDMFLNICYWICFHLKVKSYFSNIYPRVIFYVHRCLLKSVRINISVIVLIVNDYLA